MGKPKRRLFQFQSCRLLLWWAVSLILVQPAACTSTRPTLSPEPTSGSAAQAAPAAIATPVFAPTLRPTRTPPLAPTSSSTPPAAGCAPFAGYTQAELLTAVSNPFNPPPPGSEDPHQAIDLAVVQNGMALTGGAVHAVLAGRVAMLVHNRFPYGNAVLVETPLDELPVGFLSAAALPAPAPTLPPHPVLTCPALQPPGSAGRSLYLLYAHLDGDPALQVGQALACGANLGALGQSGNALNPHLHLEVRLGPSGWAYSSMAHYDSTAGAEEMGAYCLWRVSNLFQLVDPTTLLASLP